jgi:hypothetical protein
VLLTLIVKQDAIIGVLRLEYEAGISGEREDGPIWALPRPLSQFLQKKYHPTRSAGIVMALLA